MLPEILIVVLLLGCAACVGIWIIVLLMAGLIALEWVQSKRRKAP